MAFSPTLHFLLEYHVNLGKKPFWGFQEQKWEEIQVQPQVAITLKVKAAILACFDAILLHLLGLKLVNIILITAQKRYKSLLTISSLFSNWFKSGEF